jgi:hypothetical protein
MPSITGKLGVSYSKRDTVPTFAVGTSDFDDANRSWVYVGPAANAISAAATCTVTGPFAVNATAGNYTADVAFATGEYGWVRKTTTPL